MTAHAKERIAPIPGFMFFIISFFLTAIGMLTLMIKLASKPLNEVLLGLGLIIAGLISSLVMFTGVAETIFPTAAIYRGTASLLERYAPEIGFWGMLLGLLGMALSFWFYKKPRTPVPNKDTA